MKGENSSPSGMESPNNVGGVGSEEEIRDLYNPEIKNLADIENLTPLGQLEYLAGVVEASDTDIWYAVFEAGHILDSMAEDDHFSPLIRTVASGLKSVTELNNDYRRPEQYEAAVLDESFGYYSIATPDMIPLGILGEQEEDMNETEIKSELKQIEKQLSGLPDEIQGDTTVEKTWRYLNSRYNELQFALGMIYFRRSQTRLHNEFPSVPREKQLVRIAPDAVATVDFQKKYDNEESDFSFGASIETILGENGHNVSELSDDTYFGLDAESISFLKIVHGNNYIKSFIQETIGIALNKIPIKSQACLLKFMTGANNARFDILCSALQKIENKNLRIKLLENFVAADFGEDFGDALLDIANSSRISGEQLEEILDKVSSCRESIREISGLYDKFDSGVFASQYARAANERLTDAITVFREIANNGSAQANLGWPGAVEFDYNKAMEALNYEAKSLDIISGTLGDVASGKDGAFAEPVLSPDAHRGRSLYNFYSPDHGYALLYTRPEGAGSFDSSFEYGKNRSRYDKSSSNVGVEASISLIVNPVDPFALPNPFKPNAKAIKNPNFYDPSTMDKVSALRIDREGRIPGAPADDLDRDPVNPNGTVSVDLAAIGDRVDTPSGKIARLLSVGGALRTGDDNSALNHNTHWFDQAKYGTDKGFKRLVDYIDSMAKEWCGSLPPGKNEGFRGAMRTAKKKMGNYARKAAA